MTTMLDLIKTGGRSACGPNGWLQASARAARDEGRTRDEWEAAIAHERPGMAIATLRTQWGRSKVESPTAPVVRPAQQPDSKWTGKHRRPASVEVPRDPGCRLSPFTGQWVCPGCTRTFSRHQPVCPYC